MQTRINEAQNNKEEFYNLLNEQKSVMKKISMMRSLNEKYRDQYEELTGEKFKKKKKKKNKKNKKNKKTGDTSSTTNSTVTEHDHDHGDSDEGEEEIEHHHCGCGHAHH